MPMRLDVPDLVSLFLADDLEADGLVTRPSVQRQNCGLLPPGWRRLCMKSIKCRLCGAKIHKDEAPFPVVRPAGPFLWYCSQDCMAVEWPDAKPPIAPGDMFTCDYIAFEQPRKAMDLGEYDRLTATEEQGGGYYYLGIGEDAEHKLPIDQWAILFAHDKDPNLFFLVPWTGNEDDVSAAQANDADENSEGCMYGTIHEALAVYTAWQHKDTPEAKTPRSVFLFLGRGVWRRRSDLDASARQQHLTEESVKAARQAFTKMIARPRPA